MKRNVIRTQNLSKTYNVGDVPVQALDEVDLEIEDGSFVSVTGTSGSGKSTLMHIIGGLDRPTSGDVYVDDVSLNGMNDKSLSKIRREKMGFVFQKFCLVQELKVIENIVLPILLSDRKPDMEYIDRLCETLGIANRKDHYPSELSGGQQQRVAIARALSNNPDIILCDEPTGNLDKNTSQEVIDLLCGINHEYGKTLLIVTHDPDIAAKADRQIRIEDGKLYE
jgi:putative ABC transport system ATP-binding protein